MRTCWTAMILTGASICLSGCGESINGPSRYRVQGKVTLNGVPVERGTITFGALDAKQAIPGTANINQGAYEVDKGLPAGDYRVVVETVSVNLRDTDFAKKAPEKPSKLPKYADPKATDLEFTVKSGTNTADFDLED